MERGHSSRFVLERHCLAMIEDDGARLTQLLSQLRARGKITFRSPKVHPAEVSNELLETLGFRSAGEHRLYAARARSA